MGLELLHIFIYSLLLLLLAVAAVATWYARKRCRAEERTAQLKTEIAELLRTRPELNYETAPDRVVEALIAAIGAKRENVAEVEDEAESGEYLFSYQDGYFHLHVGRDENGELHRRALLHFFNIATVEPAHIVRVRAVCNKVNEMAHAYRACYTIAEETGELHIHLSASYALVDDSPQQRELFLGLVQGFFGAQRFLYSQLEHFMNLKYGDLERRYVYSLYEIALLEERRLAEQQETFLPAVLNRHPQLTVCHFFDLLGGMEHGEPHYLCVTGGDLTYLATVEEISDYTLREAITPLGDGNTVTVTAGYEASANGTNRTDNAVITIEKLTPETAYLRITYLCTTVNCRGIVPDGTPAEAQPRVLHMAFDIRDAEKRRAEFDYMYREAHDLLRAGRGEQLSREQRLMVNGALEDGNPYHLYWGEYYYHERHYEEALMHLLPVWKRLNFVMPQLDKDAVEAFHTLTFHIGMCYNIIGDYERAFYYLHPLTALGRIDYMEEFARTLCANSDYRALTFLEGLYGQVQHDLEEKGEEEMPEGFSGFYRALRRLYAECLERYCRPDEAKRLYEEMLDEPENCDYAISRLAQMSRPDFSRKCKEEKVARKGEADRFARDVDEIM